MPGRNAAVGLLASLALAGCEGAVAPDRGPAYEFVAPGTDQVFHWPQDRLPVRYWVAPDTGYVWKSVQWTGPKMFPIMLEIMRPYAAS